jgi:hypothetical protein
MGHMPHLDPALGRRRFSDGTRGPGSRLAGQSSTTTQTELHLARRWREEASLLRRRAASIQADVLESCAAELAAWAQERELQPLTLEQAAAESGYTYSAIEKMVRRGAIGNVGKKGAPRIRRGDLPRRAAGRARPPAPEISALALGA